VEVIKENKNMVTFKFMKVVVLGDLILNTVHLFMEMEQVVGISYIYKHQIKKNLN